MIRAIRAVTTERGRDPRQFTLVAFGGSGPVHAAEMARALGIRRVVIPPVPGLFSALGLLFADVERRVARAALRRVSDASVPEIEVAYGALEAEARAALERDGYTVSAVSRSADLRYVGQSESLLVELPASLRESGAEQIAAAFDAEHERRYGHRWERAPIELVNLRVSARALTARPPLRGTNGRHPEASAGPAAPTRTAFFGPHGTFETPILAGRAALGTSPRSGPLVIEEYDATIVVPPGCTARLDETGNVFIAIELA
jgi:N-methylhydantoinase A